MAAAAVTVPGVSTLTAVDSGLRLKSDYGNVLQKSKVELKSQFWGNPPPALNLAVNAKSTTFSGSGSSPIVVARLFGPAIFEASKLKVLLLSDRKPSKSPEELLPRAYTVTHSDITAKITLAISQTVNKSQIQGWYNKLQRDEVLAEWKRCQGSMSLHVHCHISGGHWLLDAIAQLRFYIFRKELPVVLQAFIHGDETLFMNHPELQDAMVWVYFHSNVEEFNLVECWGPLREAACKGAAARATFHSEEDATNLKRPVACPHACNCCAPSWSVIPMPPSFQDYWHRPDLMTNEEPQTSETAPGSIS